jgi:hypothetical protein
MRFSGRTLTSTQQRLTDVSHNSDIHVSQIDVRTNSLIAIFVLVVLWFACASTFTTDLGGLKRAHAGE